MKEIQPSSTSAFQYVSLSVRQPFQADLLPFQADPLSFQADLLPFQADSEIKGQFHSVIRF